MHASPSHEPSRPHDGPQETHILISPPQPSDNDRVIARFASEHPDGWKAHGAISRTWRGLAITQLEVVPWIEVDNEPGHITSSLLRQIPTGAILAAAQSAVAQPETSPTERPEKRQPGRQPLSDELLLAVADGYLLETSPGRGRGAIGRLAERMGKPAPTVSRWVMRARADGWLGPAVPGREGAEPGAKYINAVGAKMVGRALDEWMDAESRKQQG